MENGEVKSEFEIIFKNGEREWALSTSGVSRVSPKFYETWERRTQPLGGEDRFLDGLLAMMWSWSSALGTLEDWMESQE
jgi:hypothetical protein